VTVGTILFRRINNIIIIISTGVSVDRNTVTGLILIFIITLAWFYFTAPTADELAQQERERAIRDSIAAQTVPARPDSVDADTIDSGVDTPPGLSPTLPPQQSLGFFAPADSVDQQDISLVEINTPLYSTTLSNLGAGPVRFELANYYTWDGKHVQLISDSTRSVYSLGFTSAQNYNIDTNRLRFKPLFEGNQYSISEGDSLTLAYELTLGDRGNVRYEYTLYGGSYEIGLNIIFTGAENILSSRTTELGFNSTLNYSERYLSTEAIAVSAYSYAGDELEQFMLSEPGREEKIVNGNINWVSTKTKFFTQIIKPLQVSDGAYFTGERIGEDTDPLAQRNYTSAIRANLPADNILKYRLFVGPLSYSHLKEFDEHTFDMVEVGYFFLRWFSDPLVRYAIIPYFTFFSGFIPNYGILIILFAVIIKLVLYPLTKKSFESMAAMREIQPEMKLIQDKYKDDPPKQQQAMLKLYKEAKVNPLGGCLPNLLQLPILVTLWMFFQNSILIRQKPFLWADDLSAPDVILNLPFNIPLLGDHISGFVLLMTITMIVQMQISGQTAPNNQMKVLTYIMPAMLFVFFNNIAAGLSLYYMIYNVLSIGQQMLINKQIDHAKLMGTIDKKAGKEIEKVEREKKRLKPKD
jgi:YidC/Oxa1 family membrane protein insertase